MTNLIDLKASAEGGKITRLDGGLLFHAEGPQLDSAFHAFVLEGAVLEDYLVLDYRIIGIRRILRKRGVIIFGMQGGKEIPLVCYDDLFMDNLRHRLAVKVNAGSYDSICFRFQIDRRTKADWQLYGLSSCRREELLSACQNLRTEKAEPFRMLDLSDYFNREYQIADPNCIIDGGRFFETESISLMNIPFRVSVSGNNLIAPPPPPAENEDIILNFGVQARRRLCRPISRDSCIVIPLSCCATEIFFLMDMEGRRHQRWGYATDGTILGQPNGEVQMPQTICDVEGFHVEILYADGHRDTAMPMNLGIGRHLVEGDMSLYAVPADGTEIAELVFHNRLLDTDCCIAAVTLNDTSNRRYPEMLNPIAPKKIIHTVPDIKKLSLTDSILTVQSGALLLKVDISRSMTLLELHNDFADTMTVKSAPMLRVLDDHRNPCFHISLEKAEIRGNDAEIIYRCLVPGTVPSQVLISVQVSVEEENAILFHAFMQNSGTEELRFAVQFPVVSGLVCGNLNDSWYFLPKYQEHVSNETIWMYEESAPSFPLQYMDVFSPASQGGLAMTTRERDLVVRKYALEKDENGISFFVEYPAMYGRLAAHESRRLSPTLLAAHDGDWRSAFAIYKKWLDSWYQPYHCQNKQWYKECFWLLAEITDFFETTEITRFPVWYQKENRHFRFLDIMEEQKQLTGYYPDILHLWSWTYYEDVEGQQYGNFGEDDYNEYGGLEALRAALHEVEDKTGAHVSIYMHPTLLSKRYPQAKEFYPKYRVCNEQGEYINLADHSYRMCHASKPWRDYAVSMYPRVWNDLQIPLLYVDEFSLRVENRCYTEGHGHEVPSNLLKTDRDFITQLKDSVPENVVLYGEYAPVDLNARYIDCNISYSYLDAIVDMIETAWRAGDGDDRLSRIYIDTYRFAFPGLVQLVLPMAMRNLSWHPQKFFFFNGTAIYDSFWDIEESRGHAFTIHAYSIKKKYADCFSSSHPETMIDTLTPAVCANCFPGKGRTLYTLYNRGYQTFRGAVLRVPHQQGNVYYDAWNDKPLQANFLDGFAELMIEIDAMQMGCIVIERV